MAPPEVEVDSIFDLGGCTVRWLMDFIAFPTEGGCGVFVAGAEAAELIRGLARGRQNWRHIDAGYGAFSTQAAEAWMADSVALDARTWLGSSFDSCCILARDGDALRRAVAQISTPRERVFRALQFWTALAQTHQPPVRERVRRHEAMVRGLARMVDAEPELERLSPVEMTTVSFRWAPRAIRSSGKTLDETNLAILAALPKQEAALVNRAQVNGRVGVRVCVLGDSVSAAACRDLVKTVVLLGGSLS